VNGVTATRASKFIRAEREAEHAIGYRPVRVEGGRCVRTLVGILVAVSYDTRFHNRARTVSRHAEAIHAGLHPGAEQAVIAFRVDGTLDDRLTSFQAFHANLIRLARRGPRSARSGILASFRPVAVNAVVTICVLITRPKAQPLQLVASFTVDAVGLHVA
jgi:hypothetical protein